MVETVVLVPHNIHIDGGSTAVEEIAGLVDEVGKVVVGVAVVHLIVRDAAVTGEQREIHHETAVGAVGIQVVGVPDGLRCPDTRHLGPCGALIAGGEIHGGVGPVDEVARAHKHQAAVAVPALRALHISDSHIEPAIGAAQDMGVAQSTLHRTAVGRNHTLAAIQRGVVITVAREGVVDILVIVGGEIDKEIRGVGLVGVDRDIEVASGTLLTPADGGCQRDVLLAVGAETYHTSIIAEIARIVGGPEHRVALGGYGR